MHALSGHFCLFFSLFLVIFLQSYILDINGLIHATLCLMNALIF